MSRAVVAEFETAEAMLGALEAARREGRSVLDAWTPYPLTEAARSLTPDWMSVRLWALAGAVLMAVFAFAIQWWSGVRLYPFNTGARPLNSWPVYLLTLFEVSVLSGAVWGCAAFLFKAGLPKLNHAVFEIEGFERASQDRFFLALAAPERDQPAEMALVDFFRSHGALRTEGVEL